MTSEYAHVPYKSLDNESLWFTRRVASRARRAMTFIDDLTEIATSEGGYVRTKQNRTSVDVVRAEEGDAWQRSNPAFDLGRFFRKFARVRGRRYEGFALGDYTTVRLGEVVTWQASDTLGYIGAEVTDPEGLLRDRREVSQLLESLGGSALDLSDTRPFLVDYATFHPDHTEGIEEVVAYAAEHSPASVDLFDVIMMHPAAQEALVTRRS